MEIADCQDIEIFQYKSDEFVRLSRSYWGIQLANRISNRYLEVLHISIRKGKHRNGKLERGRGINFSITTVLILT